MFPALGFGSTILLRVLGPFSGKRHLETDLDIGSSQSPYHSLFNYFLLGTGDLAQCFKHLPGKVKAVSSSPDLKIKKKLSILYKCLLCNDLYYSFL